MSTIQHRRSTAAAATTSNPVLAAGEFGVETDTGKVKVGNGTTAWTALPYLGGGTGGGAAPTAHAGTHATGGTDAVALAASQITSGALAPARLATGTPAAGMYPDGAGAWTPAPSMPRAPTTLHTPETINTYSNGAQSAATPQVAVWMPCYIDKSKRIIATTYLWTPETGASMRASLWTLDTTTCRPGTLIEDLGLMSASGSGGARSLSASVTSVSGWFFLAAWVSNHVTARWNKDSATGTPNDGTQMFGTPGPASGQSQRGWRATALDYSTAWSPTLPTLSASNSGADANDPYLWWSFT